MNTFTNYAERLQSDQFVIFLLHGVVERNTHSLRNYTRKHLEKDAFVGFLKTLCDVGTPVSMDDVLGFCEGLTPPDNAFAITFDDGFENNLSVAAPILADFNVPATFYITTDFVENNRMSWVDRIEWAVEASPDVALALPWRSDKAGARTTTEKRALMDEIRRHVKQDSSIHADDVATDIQIQCGFVETWSSDDALDQKLDWAGVRALHADPLFTVGGHTHTHAILSFLDDAALAGELDTSLDLLRHNANIGPNHYSYPEGLAHCYSETVIAALKSRGVKCCPTAEDGVNAADVHPFHLKRVFVV